MGFRVLAAVHGIEGHQTRSLGIADILGYGEGQRELSVSHAVGTVIKDLCTVIIDKCRIGTLTGSIIQPASDSLLSIADGSRHHTRKVIGQSLP